MTLIFLIFLQNIKKILKTGRDSLTASQKVVHKTDEFLGNKTVDPVTNLYDDKIVKTKPVVEIIIRPKWNLIKYISY